MTTSEAENGFEGIRATQLEFRYSRDGESVLRGLDLGIELGRRSAIVGPSGCGKSTLLRLIAGLEQPTGGSIEWCRGAEKSGRVGMLFQGQSHFPWRSVRANLALPLEIQGIGTGERDDRILAVVGDMGLPVSLLDRRMEELSGGQVRRVELAMTLAAQPDVLLLDEPTTGLDFAAKRQTQTVIERALPAVGNSVTVTHDIEEAILLSDDVSILSSGRVVGRVDVDISWPRTTRRLEIAEAVEALIERVGAFFPAAS